MPHLPFSASASLSYSWTNHTLQTMQQNIRSACEMALTRTSQRHRRAGQHPCPFATHLSSCICRPHSSSVICRATPSSTVLSLAPSSRENQLTDGCTSSRPIVVYHIALFWTGCWSALGAEGRAACTTH